MKDFHSGHLMTRTGFKSFEPSLINRKWTFTSTKLLESLSKADRQLGRLDMFSEYVPDLDLFLRMHVAKEATQSSRIEDTKTEIEEVILPEEDISQERRDDWREVNNYISAMNLGLKQIEDLPFSIRLIKSTHNELMQGARGENKTPGKFRVSQNWIGGSNPGNARYVPPAHENVPELMSDLESFAHNPDLHIPPLLKAGIMHYQFETIHPFLDGNGRIGRLMIPLYLVCEGILKQPVLYLSDYLARNRDEYYERLTRARQKNEIENWLIFFLDGVSETAANGIETFDKILKFQKQWESEISNWKNQSKPGLLLFHGLFNALSVNAGQVSELADISPPTAYKLIDRFCEAGLLNEITGAKRGRIFIFKPYLDLFA